VHGIVTQLQNVYLAGIRFVNHGKRFAWKAKGLLQQKKGINFTKCNPDI